MPQDENLQQNQAIESAILTLQKNPTQEELAHTLTVLRRCVQARGQWIAAVEPLPGASGVRPKTVTADDGTRWWYAFTSFEEQMQSPDAVKSSFLTEAGPLLTAALDAPDVQGVILNPWRRTLQLDKTLIGILLPK